MAQSYPGARLVVETSLASVAGVWVVGRGAPLHTLLAQVATKYVLLAGDLDTVTTWANIERGVSFIINKPRRPTNPPKQAHCSLRTSSMSSFRLVGA